MIGKENETLDLSMSPEDRKHLNAQIFNQYGMIRVMIKTLVYHVWFFSGFFTPFWMYHFGLFVGNHILSKVFVGKKSLSETGYVLQLSMYLCVYLSILFTFFKI